MKKLFVLIGVMIFFSCQKEKKMYIKYQIKCNECTTAYMHNGEVTTAYVYGQLDKSFIMEENEVASITVVNAKDSECLVRIFERGKIVKEKNVKKTWEQITLSYTTNN